jgi:hypothetical protein
MTTPASAETSPIPVRRAIPISDWPKYHPWPTVSGLRNLVFNADSNGLADAVIRVGRRVLIDESSFWDWARDPNRNSRASRSRRARVR